MALTHKPKAEVLSPRNAMALDTLAGVRGEMARLYRLGLNGKIRSDEMTRFIYALKEIRACLEAEILTDVQQRLALLSRDMGNQNGHGILHQPTFPREQRMQQNRPFKVVTVRYSRDEDRNAANDRHFAAHPEDRDADVVIFHALPRSGNGQACTAPAGPACRAAGCPPPVTETGNGSPSRSSVSARRW